MAPRVNARTLALTLKTALPPSPPSLLPRQPGQRQGLKPVYLPNITLTLLRTPFLPPNFATFLTPLSFNKLDLKSYLLNAYSLPTISIRSFVQQQPVRQDKPSAKIPKPRKWFRPRAIKKMIVEMDQPFVWPAEIEDFTPWDKERWEGAKNEQKEERDERQANMGQGAEGELGVREERERESVRKQAQALLSGKERWRRVGERALGEMEVEQGVLDAEDGWEEVDTEQRV